MIREQWEPMALWEMSTTYIWSLRKNLDSLQTHILNELNFNFSFLVVMETRINDRMLTLIQPYQITILNMFQCLFLLEM